MNLRRTDQFIAETAGQKEELKESNANLICSVVNEVITSENDKALRESRRALYLKNPLQLTLI